MAKAAEACADAGNVSKAVEITLDIEQPLYEVTTLLNAVRQWRAFSECPGNRTVRWSAWWAREDGKHTSQNALVMPIL